MAATTTLLGLVTPTQGTLSGTWGDTVNYGISDYLDIAIAGTLSFAGDGAITLANTTGSSSGNAITSTTAQYMVIRITGTQTVTKVITGPSYSKLYMVDHAGATSAVTFKAAAQTGVSIAVGEKCFVYYNGTDYIKVSSIGSTGVLSPTGGGTGVANNAASTLAISGNFATTLTVSGTTGVTLPTTGTLSTLAGTETFTNKTLTNPTVTNYVESVVAIGNSGTTQTLSLTSGTVQTVTMTGNCTFTMPTATAGKSFILICTQDGTGGRTATFTSVKFPGGVAPTLTTTATTGVDILTFVANGTSWFGTYAQAFA